jgi:hypothetical protein
MLCRVVVSAVLFAAPDAMADPAPTQLRQAVAATSRRAAPLDLQLGDIRRFIPAEELDVPLDQAVDEVVVRSRRVREALPEQMPIPRGVDGFGWLLRNPTQIWRLFVPDPNMPGVPSRSPDDPIESPGAYRTRIGQPGRLIPDTYDPNRDPNRDPDRADR